MKYILASGSPRRKELLGSLGINFEIIPATGEEIITSEVPSEVVTSLSKQKAKEIFHKVLRDNKDTVVVIGSDTVVSYKEKILGKPKDRKDAGQMISDIAGTTHEVYTGVSVVYGDNSDEKEFTFYECTKVKVFPMSEDEIEAYLDTDEPYDKAGAYGIQGLFGKFVEGIEGDYNNVVGLPLSRLYQELKARNII
ncbi:nucleoside triphosphate pyrophosphatase [Butyrivibrio sp. INlla16]|uniref:Maf family protein n=1 Tax=Butyrivibrio sp. INlla16 TaxID=1520807 RepID=UPI000883B047|nr:Maf family protein [Butyrivibrio sp. INlla16]SDB42651.1 septum formation protein [Butyrivibrio sp. INlla16]